LCMPCASEKIAEAKGFTESRTQEKYVGTLIIRRIHISASPDVLLLPRCTTPCVVLLQGSQLPTHRRSSFAVSTFQRHRMYYYYRSPRRLVWFFFRGLAATSAGGEREGTTRAIEWLTWFHRRTSGPTDGHPSFCYFTGVHRLHDEMGIGHGYPSGNALLRTLLIILMWTRGFPGQALPEPDADGHRREGDETLRMRHYGKCFVSQPLDIPRISPFIPDQQQCVILLLFQCMAVIILRSELTRFCQD
jgi:hypothetical protein